MARKKKEDSEKEEIKKPKELGPFDIIKMMFTNKQAFDKLSDLMLSKNFFMINRIFSIQFPEQAQCFNKTSIDPSNVIRVWRDFAVRKIGYGRVPGFVYTKGAKSVKAEQEKILDIDNTVKESYCLFYNISLNDFNDMLYFNYNSLKEHINFYVNNIYNPKDTVIKSK